MQTDALRWFQQVADGVTVTEVSETERVTQPGVSRALARLEQDVGTALLLKSGRTLRMTHAGSVFKRHVDALLHELDDGIAAVNQLVDPETGTVSLAFQLSLGTWLVPDLVSSFRALHPGVRFELRQVHDDQLSTVLSRGEVDFEISTVRPSDSALQWHAMMPEALQLAVPSNHRLAGRSSIALVEAEGEPFVALRTSTLLRQLLEELCEEAGFEPLVAFQSDDLPTVHGFVAAGLGIAVVPAGSASSSRGANGSEVLIDIASPRASREIGLAWSVNRRLLPAAELFREHVMRRPGGIEVAKPALS
jgi:LysR family transcriptional activator of glutamate synthase operon